jgi:hypothetical protein
VIGELGLTNFSGGELRDGVQAPYIDRRLAHSLFIIFLQGSHLFFLSFFL